MAVGEEGVGVGESLSLCDERWNVFLRRDVRESGVEDLRGAKSCLVGGGAEVGRGIGCGLGGVRGCEWGGGGGGGEDEGERGGTGFRVLEFVLRFPFPIPFASSNP